MWLVDLNVLIHATHDEDRHHERAHAWLGDALTARGGPPVGLAWIVLVGFLRLSTHPTLRPRPLTDDQALGVVDGWLGLRNVRIVNPRDSHVANLRHALASRHQSGNFVNDAHLAALAMEHRATVVSYDTDFGKFAGLKWRTPDQLLNEASQNN